jgi:hypothetical protein
MPAERLHDVIPPNFRVLNAVGNGRTLQAVAISWNDGSVPKKMAPILPMQSASRFLHRAARGLLIDR